MYSEKNSSVGAAAATGLGAASGRNVVSSVTPTSVGTKRRVPVRIPIPPCAGHAGDLPWEGRHYWSYRPPVCAESSPARRPVGGQFVHRLFTVTALTDRGSASCRRRVGWRSGRRPLSEPAG